MRVRTPEGAYQVIRVLKEDLSIRFYLAGSGERMTGQNSAAAQWKKGPLYLLLEIVNPALSREMLVPFMELKNSGYRTRDSGFVTCFAKEGNLWAVFRYHMGAPITEWAGQIASCEERLHVWDSLLTQIFFQELPAYLQFEAVNPANLVMDEECSVHVNYLLRDSDRRGDALFPEIQQRLSESFQVLFASETALKGSAAADYAERLSRAEFVDGTSLYRGFREMQKRLREQKKEQLNEQACGQGIRAQEGVLVKLWGMLFSHAHMAGKCLYFLLVAALWAVFVLLCIRPQTAPEQRSRISSIGTVEIIGCERPGVEKTEDAGIGDAEEAEDAEYAQTGSGEEAEDAETGDVEEKKYSETGDGEDDGRHVKKIGQNQKDGAVSCTADGTHAFFADGAAGRSLQKKYRSKGAQRESQKGHRR